MGRSGLDQNMWTNWGNDSMRQDHQQRPKSLGMAWIFDEKAFILTYSVAIGQNFEEDECKPLDGV
jgi:hypothetical protein